MKKDYLNNLKLPKNEINSGFEVAVCHQKIQ